MPRINYNIKFFEKESSDLSYFLGFLMSDGYFNKSVSFGIKSTDREILDFFASKIGGKVKEQSVYDKRCDKVYHKVRYTFQNRDINNILFNYGFKFGPKTGKEFLPPINKLHYPDFIRGLFDGDGYVCNNGNGLICGICCANIEFLETIKNILPLNRINKNGSIYCLSTTKCHNVIEFSNYIYNGNFCLARKKKMFDDFSIDKLHRVPFSDIEIDIINNGGSYNDIATKLGRDANCIRIKSIEIGATKIKEPRFTKQENQFIIDNIKHINLKEEIEYIAKQLNRSISSINHKITRLGLRKQKKWTNEEILFLKENITKDPSWIAQKLGKSEQSIKSKIWRIK